MVAPEESAPPSSPREDPPPPANPPAAEAPASVAPADEWSIRYRYLLAEFDNYRKRIEREQATLRRDSRALVLRELLPLHDAFDRAEAATRELSIDDPFRRGLELLFREWERFLATEKVQPVAREGEVFRPEEEEAVGEVPADAEHPGGTVAEVIQQGFRCSGGLLRAAKVLIARAPARSGATGSSKPTIDVGELTPPGEKE